MLRIAFRMIAIVVAIPIILVVTVTFSIVNFAVNG